ncbi:hypothetical protein ERX37_04355 [Macrococcus hajekii]|uniref:Uncharacterized protein n=1 Tax=Macrococcus hajekii TaxID=198482 RepID=A0A4R6BN94_9STAP|nr:UPF0223 family protein [Macrococcus hajekii]TDM03323.1 hypothetical protein ERX37_04355 [Macrococcus hajekii]GGA97897.1 UPF0223 protein [Macrococcus hajekii]
MEYSYPLDLSWTPDEMVAVVDFLAAIEKSYESKIDTDELKQKYDRFKQVCPGKAEENNIYKDFKKVSGYDGYPVIKKMKEQLTAGKSQAISMEKL